MKKIFILSLFLVQVLGSMYSQIPETLSYQAIARDPQGNLLGNQDLKIRIGIIQNETLVWQEDHQVLTNDLGLFTLDIGSVDATGKIGTVDAFSDIPWEAGSSKMQISVDSGSGFEELGTNEFHAVPYALYAADGPGGTGPQGEPGPQGAPGPAGADEQELALEGNILSITGGNSLDLTPVAGSDGAWATNLDTLSTMKYVGIGTANTNQSALTVQGFNVQPETPLFEVRREDGFPVFAVFSDRVMVYVDEEAKGIRGGFSVGGYSRKAKGVTQEYLTVTSDSTRIYVPQEAEAKGIRGGFAVGGYSKKAKGVTQDYLTVTPDSTRVYVPNKANDPGVVGLQGGFAVGGFTEGSKGSTDYLMGINRGITRFNTSDNDRGFAIGSQGAGWGSNYLELTPTNSFIGFDAGLNTQDVDPIDEDGWGLSSMNVFVGYQSGMYNEYGHHNTFLGFCAGTNTLGDWGDPEFAAHNTFIGTQSGFNNEQGSYNVYMGCYSGFDNLNGVQNVFIGGNAGYTGVNTSYSTMVGNNAGSFYNGDGGVTFLGFYAGSNSSGINNTFMGASAGSNAGVGSENIYLGRRTGQFAEGDQNIVIGNDAGRGVGGSSSFSEVTLVGDNSGSFLTTGVRNSFFGGSTGPSVSTGGHNTLIGYSSGFRLSTGGNNVMVGTYAGYDNVSGFANVFLGHLAGSQETGSNQLYIDNTNTVDPLIWGDFLSNFLIVYGDLQVEGTLYEVSDINKKKNINPLTNSLEKVMALNGVSFEWIRDEESKGDSKVPTESIGVIAQNVEAVLPSLVSEKRNGAKAVNYSGLIPVLLEAIKEQQGQIELLERRISELEH